MQKAPLAVAALRLRNAHPEAFKMFVNEFATYTNDVVYSVISAPVGEVLIMQGRAQQCTALLRLFNECHIERAKTEPTPQ